MKDPTSAFFEEIDKHAFDVLHKATGTLRIDLKENGRTARWFVRMDKGAVFVSHKDADADCILQTDKASFDRIVTGRSNAMTAVLRGTLAFEGDPLFLVLFGRLFGGSRPALDARSQGGVR